ncbi:hypothetical protein CDD80_5515 [Ophiocordyceps camponoti-rufipedis]|uniref:Calcineurin-like phosphoesterase domain-containing protein n=1 Tax=Ophiocordyceps camponoti-rufipedis TaxID=2004952 RepID=A0A2C5YM35_9HYPO|nr:hypothetical protein CDD80_5515 [Ophiocordyceps camponoti-rufipedis]
MPSSCRQLRDALAQCLQESDCVMVQRNKASDCLRSPLVETLPTQCQQLKKGFGECKRGMVDMRKRFRGNMPVSYRSMESDKGHQLYAGKPAFAGGVRETSGDEPLPRDWREIENEEYRAQQEREREREREMEMEKLGRKRMGPTAQQRILVFAATFFFLSSVYLCTTRLFAMSFSSDDDNGPSPPPTQLRKSRSPPPSSPAGDMAVVSPADLPMSYGEYRRPGLQGLDKVVATLPRWLVPTRANGRRLVVVGDIHGMDRELERLLHRVGLDPRRDHVIAAGDMVAKGPDSAAVVARLMSLDASAVRGNHEDRVLLSRAEAEAARGLLGAQLAEADGARRKGQADALAVAANLSVEQVAWLSQLPVVLVADPLPLYVVHAGLVPGVALDKQDPWAIMNMRSLVYPRQQLRAKQAADTTTMTTTALDRAVAVPVSGRDGEPWTDGWNRFHENEPESHRRTVVYGHDARVGFLERNYSLGLDSGCVRGGALTAAVIRAAEEGGFSRSTFQVACRKKTR